MVRIGEQPAKNLGDTGTFVVVIQHILEPVQNLDDAHSRLAGPVEGACCGCLEVDFPVAELDGL